MSSYPFVFTPSFRKWLGFICVILCAFIPYAGLYTLSSFSTFIIFTLFAMASLLSGVLVYKQWHSVMKALRCREVNTENFKEVTVENLLFALTKKANLSDVKLKILLGEGKQLKFESLGWPYPAQVFLSEAVMERYEAGLSQTSLEALLAHELGHITFFDIFFKQIVAFFVMFLRITLTSILLAPFFLGYSGGALLAICSLLTLLCGALVFAQTFFDKLSKRARENLADVYALRLTTLSNVVNSLYDCYLPYLYWNEIVIEDSFAEPHRYILSDKSTTSLPLWQAKRAQYPSKLVYLDLKHKMAHILPVVSNSLFTSCATWFNNYPTLEERENALKPL